MLDGLKQGTLFPESPWCEMILDAARRTEISATAYRLLRKLVWLCENFEKPYAYPARGTLGRHLGISERQVSHYLAELRRTGLLRSQRNGSANSRHFPMLPARQTSPQPARQTARQTSGSLCQGFEELNSSSNMRNAPAAAAPVSIAKAGEAAEALEVLGLPNSLASRAAVADADLAAVAAEFFRSRFADNHREPIRDRVAFMRGVLSNPEDACFERLADGTWKPPPDYAGPDRRKTEQDQIDAQVAERRRKAEEMRCSVR